jgi:FkbM family methyltransferase
MLTKIKKIMYPVFARCVRFVKTHILIDRSYILTNQFKEDDQKLGLRLDYPLDEDSIVFDLGGYKGEWAMKIWERYKCNIHVFEPIKTFYEQARSKFEHNPKVRLYNFGLSDQDEHEHISLANDASSVFAQNKNVDIELRDVKHTIDNLKIAKIDLLKINIEGGEFKVLPRMIECGLIEMCSDIQIQFHNFYPDAPRLREDIRKSLKLTHHLTYDYTFIFENWRKNV